MKKINDKQKAIIKYWQCDYCGHKSTKEEEVGCWQCGKGDMIYHDTETPKAHIFFIVQFRVWTSYGGGKGEFSNWCDHLEPLFSETEAINAAENLTRNELYGNQYRVVRRSQKIIWQRHLEVME